MSLLWMRSLRSLANFRNESSRSLTKWIQTRPTCKLADPKIDHIKPIQLCSHLNEVHTTIGTYETDI